MKTSNRILFALYILILMYCITMGDLTAADIKVIKNPKPTHVEKNYVDLILVKEIKDEIDEEHFFAIPTYLVPDKDGNVYVYDAGLNKIIKLDKNLRFVTMFLDKGRGPGETMGSFDRTPNMFISKFDKLYLGCPGNKKIIVFSEEGKVEKEIPTPQGFFKKFYRPVVDEGGKIYLHSGYGGVVDIFDPAGKYLRTLLTQDAFKTFVVFEPQKKFIHNHTMSGTLTTFYDILPDDGFIIYITHSSTVYLFKNNKLVKKFNVWPEKLFHAYKDIVNKYKASVKEDEDIKPLYCMSFFVDKDDEKHFYMESMIGYRSLYKFNLKGELISVLRTKNEKGNFYAKRNGYFYGIRWNEGRIFIYKEDK